MTEDVKRFHPAGVRSRRRQESGPHASDGVVPAHEPRRSGTSTITTSCRRQSLTVLSRLLASRHRHQPLRCRVAAVAGQARSVHEEAGVREHSARRSRDARSVLQLRGIGGSRHEPRQRTLRLEQFRGARTDSQHVEGRGRLPGRRLRGSIGRDWARLGPSSGSPVFDGPRMVAVLLLRFRLEPIEDALSGGRAVGSRRPRQDRPGLHGRSRPDDADGFTVLDRGSEGVHRDVASVEAHVAHG